MSIRDWTAAAGGWIYYTFGRRGLHEEPKIVRRAAQCAEPLHHASQNRCIAKSDWEPVVERIVVPVHLGEPQELSR